MVAVDDIFRRSKKWFGKFHQVLVEQIPREANKEANYLARMAFADSEEGLFRISPILELSQPSYEEEEQIQTIAIVSNIEKKEESWQTELNIVLIEGKLPDDKKEARRILVKATRHTLMGNKTLPEIVRRADVEEMLDGERGARSN